MADQHRWFKLWASAPSDDGLQRLPPALRWAWAVFGVYTKVHGDRGRIVIGQDNSVLAAQMGVPHEALIDTLKRFPHMVVEEGKPANGSCIVTWQNWHKYQIDSTVAKRVSSLRSKRRGEENKTKRRKRGEEPPIAPLPDASWSQAQWGTPEALAHLFNELAPDNVPAVETLSPERRRRANARLRAFPDRNWWVEAVGEYRHSKFLSGQTAPKPGHEHWTPGFDWFLANARNGGAENCVRVHDGEYR